MVAQSESEPKQYTSNGTDTKERLGKFDKVVIYRVRLLYIVIIGRLQSPIIKTLVQFICILQNAYKVLGKTWTGVT